MAISNRGIRGANVDTDADPDDGVGNGVVLLMSHSIESEAQHPLSHCHREVEPVFFHQPHKVRQNNLKRAQDTQSGTAKNNYLHAKARRSGK